MIVHQLVLDVISQLSIVDFLAITIDSTHFSHSVKLQHRDFTLLISLVGLHRQDAFLAASEQDGAAISLHPR